MGRDQADNAAHVVARGAGLSLAENATVQEIASAVARLVTEPNFRAAALRLGRAIAPDMKSSILVTEMETIANRPRLNLFGLITSLLQPETGRID
jgi:UDP:flavonoid glycosyltransferase YjiC (YdhE family)